MIRHAYAFESLEPYAKVSSSGGAFMAIIDEVFKTHQRVVVYGVELKHGREIVYGEAWSLEECKRFRGSKYVESNITRIRSSVKDNLDKGVFVVVSGLPCQIYALSKYLKNTDTSMDNLLLIDLLCHGTPSQSIWNDYVIWLEDKYHATLKDYSFRYKQAKWKNYPALASFSNGKTVVNSMEVRMFNSLFLSDMIMRECCYSCAFANTERPGDITLADFWGIDIVMKEFGKTSGVSLILSNSEKADCLLSSMNNQPYSRMMMCQNSDYIKFQHNLREPVKLPERRAEFQSDLKSRGFDYCVRKYMNYSFIGKCKFKTKKLLNEIGLVSLARKLHKK